MRQSQPWLFKEIFSIMFKYLQRWYLGVLGLAWPSHYCCWDDFISTCQYRFSAEHFVCFMILKDHERYIFFKTYLKINAQMHVRYSGYYNQTSKGPYNSLPWVCCMLHKVPFNYQLPLFNRKLNVAETNTHSTFQKIMSH